PPRRVHRGSPARGAGALIEQAFREEWGRVLASLIGFLGGFHLAEAPAHEGGDRVSPAGGAGALIEQAFREEWGRVLASLIGFLGDFDLAEDAAQEAFATAAERWPRDGGPRNPRAWLMTTARNLATDRIRRARALATRLGPLLPRHAAW